MTRSPTAMFDSKPSAVLGGGSPTDPGLRFRSEISGLAEDESGRVSVLQTRSLMHYRNEHFGLDMPLPAQVYKLKSGGWKAEVHVPPEHPQADLVEAHLRSALAVMHYDAFVVDRETL